MWNTLSHWIWTDEIDVSELEGRKGGFEYFTQGISWINRIWLLKIWQWGWGAGRWIIYNDEQCLLYKRVCFWDGLPLINFTYSKPWRIGFFWDDKRRD